MSIVRTAHRGGYQNRSGWWIGFEFDALTIEIFKQAIPPGNRSWDPDAKLWWFALECEALVLKVLPSFEAYLAQGSLF